MTGSTGQLSSSVRPLENPLRDVPQDWQHLADAWHWWLASEAISDGTREVYEGKLRAFYRFLHHIGWSAPIENLTSEHIRHYLVYLEKDQGFSGQTRLSHRQALRNFWKFLKEESYVQTDPFTATRIPRPKVEEKVVQPIAPLDLQALLKAARKDPYLAERDVALISVLASTGLRVGELCHLVMADVNAREGRLLIRHTKTNRDRVVSVEPLAMKALNRYLSWRNRRMARREVWAQDCDNVFITRNSGPMKEENVRNRLKELAGRAGLDPRSVHPHLLRHYSATMMADNGASVHELNAFYGWSHDSGMSQRYTASTTATRAMQSHRVIQPLARGLNSK